MSKITLAIAVLCMAALYLVGSSVAQPVTVLTNDNDPLLVQPVGYYYLEPVKQSDGNISVATRNLSGLNSMADFDLNPNRFASAVKFTAPSGWKLEKVQIVGEILYDYVNQTVPQDRTFGLEIRDPQMNLLYKFADSRLAYFSVGTPFMAEIEVPAIPVSGDFYVCFYDRGVIGIGTNITQPKETSFWYDNLFGEMVSTQVPLRNTQQNTNQTASLNWLIRAVGQ